MGERTFADVVGSRRSNRTIRQASTDIIAFVVRETLRAHYIGTGVKQGRKLKAIVSAGALHSVKAVMIDRSDRPIYYDDNKDSFLSVGIRDERSWLTFRQECLNVLPHADCHLIALIADNRDIGRLYSNHQSLLWRDAGAVIQGVALAAEALGLAFCPLGVLGGDVIPALLGEDDDFTAVGVVAIGT